MNVQTVNTFFSLLSLAALAVAVAVPILVLAARRDPQGAAAGLLADLRPLALWLAFAIAAVATAGSLYYSEVEGFVPCVLCWYQRIVMYPLAVILGIGAFRGDHRVKVYAVPLAVIGAVIAAYHYQLEVFPDQGSGVCDVSVPCTVRWFEEFGFVSLAFMALTGFLAIIALGSIAGPRHAPEDDEHESPEHQSTLS